MVGCAPRLEEAFVTGFVKKRHPHVSIVKGRAREIMASADALMITSGTATLEAGLIGTPHVLCYRLNLPNYLLARLLVKTPDIGMVNICAGRRIMPELVQFDMTPANIAKEVAAFLTDSQRATQAREDLAAMAQHIRRADALASAASEVLSAIHGQ